jgi:regulator of protease activity HflC (stomatin/prohibitin superfamily)
MTLTEVITGRDTIAGALRAGLQEQADRWGMRIVSLEIQDIKPAVEVEGAMNERRAAEEQTER